MTSIQQPFRHAGGMAACGCSTRRSAGSRHLFDINSRLLRNRSIMLGGSYLGLQVVVSDIEAARAELAGRGGDVTEVQHFPWGDFVYLKDPDGNGWAVQKLPPR